MELLRVEHLSRYYGEGPAQVKALDDVSFSVEKGEFVAIMGPSGSGKSTLMHLLGGVDKPTAGHVWLQGTDLYKLDENALAIFRRRQIGLVYQFYNLLPVLNVRENLTLPLLLDGRNVNKNQLEQLAQILGIQDRMNHLPHQLSGGQQQRTALARVLVGKPEVLLLDEPFSALDSYLKEQLMTELRKMLGYFDKDVLLVTHSRDEVYDLCDSMAIMESGKLIGMGRTKKIFSDPGTRTGAMLTGCKNIVPARAAGPRLVEIPRWGVTMHTGQDIREGLCAIGIRAHYFDEAITDNAFPVVIEELIEEPFAWIIKFRYEKQDSKSAPVWWRFSKEKKNPDGLQRTRLGIAPEDILLLYK